ncbi:MAG: rRNA maturation RNase YbeY [Spirochaetaceae bacterium]|nr:rRNA maturation RNase YbeY [Spirochaetaceae bacterium]
MNYIELISEIENPPREFSAMKSFSASKLESLEKDNWQMGIVITDDEGIRNYNRQWRKIDKATDVLSFVQDEGEDIPLMPGMPKEAGDVIISLETVARNAQEWNNSYDEELRRVIIHGILHLNGLDHPGDDYSTGMLKLQEELLGETGSLLNNKL